MNRYYWPKKSKLNLFQEANLKGSIQVELKSNYEAELFRFALYNFRRRNEIGKQFLDFQIEISDTKLTILKSIETEIKIIEKEPEVVA